MVQPERRGDEHRQPLIPHLPAVAVRAVQHAGAPPLGETRDVRQLVDESARENHSAGPTSAALSQRHGHAVLGLVEAFDLVSDELDAVARRFRASALDQVGGRGALIAEHAVHVGREAVARSRRVDDQGPAPCSSEHQRCAEARRSAADDDDVPRVCVHTTSLNRLDPL